MVLVRRISNPDVANKSKKGHVVSLLCYHNSMGFTRKELQKLKKINTPARIQDFLNAISFNFEKNGQELSSPLTTIRKNRAHCFEGALLGAYLLSLQGVPPKILCLKSTRHDFDHVVAIFRVDGYWGALSKTNHAVLRYREPIYKTIRELVMSYVHEYFLHDGRKTLRSYSDPLNLNDFKDDWITSNGDLWGIDEALDEMRYHEVIPKKWIKKLRKADPIERQVGKVVEYKR